MGGTAPANQLRLSFAGSEDGEAETETCRAAKPLWRTTTRTLRPVKAQLAEPPYADPPVRWCGRGEQVTAPPIPITSFCNWFAYCRPRKHLPIIELSWKHGDTNESCGRIPVLPSFDADAIKQLQSVRRLSPEITARQGIHGSG